MEKNKKLTEEVTHLKREHEGQALRMTKILEASRSADERKREEEEDLSKAERANKLVEDALRENDAIMIEKDEEIWILTWENEYIYKQLHDNMEEKEKMVKEIEQLKSELKTKNERNKKLRKFNESSEKVDK